MATCFVGPTQDLASVLLKGVTSAIRVSRQGVCVVGGGSVLVFCTYVGIDFSLKGFHLLSI